MSKEETKILPQLRFPEFKNDGDWKYKSIEENIDMISGIALKSNELSDDESGTPILRGINITEGYIRHSQEMDKYYKGDTSEISKYLVDENDIVIGMDGSKVGKNVALVSENDKGSILIQRVARLRAVNSDVKYLYQNFISQRFRTYVDNVNTSSGIPHISAKQIRDYKIGFPPKIKEQQKIANCLSSLDDVINAETEKLDLLQDHKKGLLQQLFPQQDNVTLSEVEGQPKYRFPEFVDDGDWEVNTLGDIAKFRRGSFPQPYGKAEWYDDENGMPFIQVYDVDTNLKIKPSTKRRISELAAEKSVFIAKGTVIITLQGSIGRVAITQYDAYIDRTLLLFEEFYKPLDKLFFAYVIQLLFEIEKEKAPGGIIKTITKEVLTNFNIYVPKIKEQQKIANCLSSVDELIHSQQQKIESLKAHKKGLLQKLFP